MAQTWWSPAPSRSGVAAPAPLRSGKFGAVKPKKREEDDRPLSIWPLVALVVIGTALYVPLSQSGFRHPTLFRPIAYGITLATLASAIALLFRYTINREEQRMYLAITFAMTSASIVLFLQVLPFVHAGEDALLSLPLLRVWGSYAIRVIFALLLSISILIEQIDKKRSKESTPSKRAGWFAILSITLVGAWFAILALSRPSHAFTHGQAYYIKEILPLSLYALTALSIVTRKGWRTKRLIYELFALVLFHIIGTVFILARPEPLHIMELTGYILIGCGLIIPFFSIQMSMYRSYRYAELHRIKESWMVRMSGKEGAQELSPVVFREIAQQLNEALAITDTNGRIVFANAFLAGMAGYDESQILHKDPSAWQHASVAQDFYARIFAKIRKDKKMYEGTVKNSSPYNREKSYDALTRITPVLDEFGDISCCVLQQRDISQEQQRLHLLRQMIDTMPLGVMLVEVPSLSISLINAQAEYLLSAGSFDLNAIKSLEDIVRRIRTPDGKEYPHDALPPFLSMQTKENAETEDVAIFMEGKVKPTMVWKMKSIPFFFADGRIQYLLVSFDDISKHREYEHQMSDFISVASHQLRTPLTSIKWTLDTLRKPDLTLSDEDKTVMFETCYEASDRMMTTIQQLLQVAELERGNVNALMEEIDLTKAIEDGVKAMKILMDRKNIRFKQSILRSIPPIRFNPFFLNQVIQNLMENAVKYTPENGEIDSILTVKDDMIEWTLHDSGIGIPKHKHDLVFKKFFRGDNAQRANPDGTGLGLYIVKSTLESVGGDIRFDSEEGVGTTMYASFPLVPKTAESA